MGRLCVCVRMENRWADCVCACVCVHVCVYVSVMYLHSCVCACMHTSMCASMHAETLMFNSELGKHFVYVAVYHKDASALPFKTSCLSVLE